MRKEKSYCSFSMKEPFGSNKRILNIRVTISINTIVTFTQTHKTPRSFFFVLCHIDRGQGSINIRGVSLLHSKKKLSWVGTLYNHIKQPVGKSFLLLLVFVCWLLSALVSYASDMNYWLIWQVYTVRCLDRLISVYACPYIYLYLSHKYYLKYKHIVYKFEFYRQIQTKAVKIRSAMSNWRTTRTKSRKAQKSFCFFFLFFVMPCTRSLKIKKVIRMCDNIAQQTWLKYQSSFHY